MANLQLSLACSDNPRTRPVIDGLVKPDGIDLRITVLHPSEMFWRQLHFEEFDVSEMSMSSLIMTTANGDTRWTGLPISTSRRFYHTGILVRAAAGIERPDDLKGKRVGVPEYQQTAALWGRAALQQLYGVRAADMRWWMERNDDRSHGSATGFKPPAELDFHYIPPEKSIASMLLADELDAALHYIPTGNLVDRSMVDFEGDSRVRPLFPDPIAEGARYYEKTGFFPMNHGFVVRRKVLEAHPWVALNIFNCFLKAKDMVNARTRELASPYFETGVAKIENGSTAIDLFPYGVKSNETILSALPRISNEQGLTPRIVGLDELFAPQTMGL